MCMNLNKNNNLLNVKEQYKLMQINLSCQQILWKLFCLTGQIGYFNMRSSLQNLGKTTFYEVEKELR